MFKVLKKSKKSNARLGLVKTAHGVIETPAFMPDATRGYVKLHDNADLDKIGTGPMVVNAFHLYLQPGIRLIEKAKGIHGFMGWDKPLVSDSGGFQVFSLVHENPKMGKISDDKVVFRSPINGEKHEFTPEKSIQIQFKLGADMIICFDDCPPNDYSRERIERAVERTVLWAKRCKDEYDSLLSSRAKRSETGERQNYAHSPDDEIRGDSRPAARNGRSHPDRLPARPYDPVRGKGKNNRPLLIAVIQGGVYKEWRKACADKLKKIGFDGYGYGARPVDSKGKFLDKIIGYTAGQIPENKIRFALGVGMPEDIIRSVRAGWDLFDCVIPTREGRHGRLFTWWKNSKKLPLQINESNKRSFYRLENIINSKYKADFSPINKLSKISELRLYSKAYLHHLFKARDPLGQKIASLNNLEFFLDLMRQIRNNISI